MKNNLVIVFDIDVDVKILLDNNVIGESGYKDTFEANIDKDGLLTIKHGMKKANIRVLKEKQNNILVSYSTSGQLKATFVDNFVANQKEDVSENVNVTVAEETKTNNEVSVSNNNPTNNTTGNTTNNSTNTTSKGANIFGEIFAFVVIGLIIWGICSFIYNKSTPSSSINGCYYITNHIYEGRGTKLCIDKSKATLTVEGTTTELYTDYIGNTLYIENEYDDILFRCNPSKEDDTKIQCDSNNKVIGVGTNVWEKQD